ncbi:NanA [Streptococcus pneumoniae]|nr:NanA [Streptococcus pneumoniae]ARD36175.1 NanA [Streptococcus pneumoniae]
MKRAQRPACKLVILFENLFKPRQLHLTTSKQCFEQPTASFLVCSLILIEYQYRL